VWLPDLVLNNLIVVNTGKFSDIVLSGRQPQQAESFASIGDHIFLHRLLPKRQTVSVDHVHREQ